MTASTTHCCRSGRARAERPRAWLAALLLALWSCAVLAGSITLREVRLDHGEEGYQLSTDVAVTLSQRLADAVTRGVPLYFVLEFEITRPRWYWLDEEVVERSQTYRLSYHALTRQYRVSTGALHQSFDTLDDALRLIGRVHGWAVVDTGKLTPGASYVAALRLRLDVTQLPKPFQLSAMSNRDWTLESDWARWGFTAQAGTHR
ncbi:DUF4390 domain-containing protein [Methyloversatilis thermotolerans]|uniref:DUF4390 domain-containing protein n=1 Tax=Methyloversatilis thermotolerans TaxID=1346290 RepID=UPI0004759014|nr:DUF4390 domain-containing protein [Methyloversatilis thermotolerans]